MGWGGSGVRTLLGSGRGRREAGTGVGEDGGYNLGRAGGHFRVGAMESGRSIATARTSRIGNLRAHSSPPAQAAPRPPPHSCPGPRPAPTS